LSGRHRLLAAALPVVGAALIVTACQPNDSAQGSVENTSVAQAAPTASAQRAPTPSAPAPATPTHRPAPVPAKSNTAAHGVRYESGLPLPDATLTPGEAFHVGPSSFCVSGYTARVRSVSQSLRYQVFSDYHIPYVQHSSYEVDHLIPLELGGDNSIKNLWPEKGSIPNAKDGLENQLHNLVCHGQLSAATAQHAIATNWVNALHTYGSSGSVYERSGSTSSVPTPPSTGGGGALDPRYSTCTEAKAHGYGPYYRGRDPEYDWYIDRDSDGIVCE
jgi:hypothetical protein